MAPANDPNGFNLAGGAMGQFMRGQLWQAYQRGATKFAGSLNPILLVAINLKAKGVEFKDEAAFRKFVDDYEQTTAGKVGAEKNAMLTLLQSRYELAESAGELSGALESVGQGSAADSVRAADAASGADVPPAQPSASTALVPTGDSGGSLAAGGGGGIGRGGGGGGRGAAAGPDNEGQDDRNVLEQIRDALRMLLIVTMQAANKPPTVGGLQQPEKPEPKEEAIPGLRELLDDAAFGEQPTTNIGRFGKRVSGLVSRTRGRFKKLGKARAAAKAATSAPGLIKNASGALAAARGGGAAAGAAGAGTGGGAGAAAGAVGAGGAIGLGLVSAGIMAAAALEFGKAVYQFARSQENEVRRLAHVGGSQAAAVAVLDAQRTGRDIKTASETSGSSSSLINSINEFEKAFQPIESLLTNIANTVGGRALDVLTGVLDAVSPVVDVLEAIYNALPGKSKIPQPESMSETIEKIAKETEKTLSPKWPGAPMAGVGGRI